MEVMISVCGETPTIGEVFHCGDAYATVVSVDTKGNPVELPFELRPDSPADKLRCAEAAYRSACAARHAKSPAESQGSVHHWAHLLNRVPTRPSRKESCDRMHHGGSCCAQAG